MIPNLTGIYRGQLSCTKMSPSLRHSQRDGELPATVSSQILTSCLITYLTLGTARRRKGNSQEDIKNLCKGWINLCAFLARCVSSGLLNRCKEGCWYPLYDISKGLQEDHPVEIIRKCFLTVAAQYFLLAGSKIYDGLVEKPEWMDEREEGLETWLLWDKRLKDIADREDEGSELGCIARKAVEKMRSVRCQAT